MKKYFKESFDKFKKDALSKLIYDVLKWLVPLSIVFALTKLFPADTRLADFISIKVLNSDFKGLKPPPS